MKLNYTDKLILQIVCWGVALSGVTFITANHAVPFGGGLFGAAFVLSIFITLANDKP